MDSEVSKPVTQPQPQRIVTDDGTFMVLQTQPITYVYDEPTGLHIYTKPSKLPQGQLLQ